MTLYITADLLDDAALKSCHGCLSCDVAMREDDGSVPSKDFRDGDDLEFRNEMMRCIKRHEFAQGAQP